MFNELIKNKRLENLKTFDPETYINDYEFDVEWKDNDTLMVNNTTTINYKQETKVHGVEVIYKYYGD